MILQGLVKQNITSMSLVPLQQATEESAGEIAFGGIDSSKFVGEMTFVPVTDDSDVSQYWGINQTVT